MPVWQLAENGHGVNGEIKWSLHQYPEYCSVTKMSNIHHFSGKYWNDHAWNCTLSFQQFVTSY